MRVLLFITAVFCIACGAPATSDRNGTKDDSVVPATPAATGVAAAGNNPAIDSNWLIVPGERVGKTLLGTDVQQVFKTLHQPDISDAAMGKAWSTWYGKDSTVMGQQTELNMYATYADTSMRWQSVQQVRTTSHHFKTADDIHVGSTSEEIQRAYPEVQKVASYFIQQQTVLLYDVVATGIAFEMADKGNISTCIGIIVHRAGKPVTAIYIMLHPDMKLVH